MPESARPSEGRIGTGENARLVAEVARLHDEKDEAQRQEHMAKNAEARLSSRVRELEEALRAMLGGCSCREELGEAQNYERCGEPGEFVLWGKLMPPEQANDCCTGIDASHGVRDVQEVAVVPAGLLGERDRTIEEMRKALFDCAVQSGEDTSGGIPTWPPIGVWAVEAVKQLRADYDECPAPEDLEALGSQLTEARALLTRLSDLPLSSSLRDFDVLVGGARKWLDAVASTPADGGGQQT